jgi:hypothetical protein
MNTELVIMTLSNALLLVILASMTMAIGLGILSGLIWLYLWLGRRMLVMLHRAYDEAVMPIVKEQAKKGKVSA